MPRKRLFLQFRNRSLNALIEDGAGGFEFQNFFLQETSKESLVTKLKMLRQKKVSETVLIIPREEVLF